MIFGERLQLIEILRDQFPLSVMPGPLADPVGGQRYRVFLFSCVLKYARQVLPFTPGGLRQFGTMRICAGKAAQITAFATNRHSS